jgi:hypothetical protein
MLHSTLLAYLNRLSGSRSKRRPQRAGPTRRRLTGTRITLEVLEDRCVPSTLTVTSSADDVTQKGTLRYAVANAQDGDTIQLTAAIKDSIVLTQGELVVSHDVTIRSVPARTPTISGGGLSRIFEIGPGAQVTLSNLILTGGNGMASSTSSDPNDGTGGAILFDPGGTLGISNCTFTGNQCSDLGGAIEQLSDQTLTITNCTFDSNTATGKGLSQFGGAGGAIRPFRKCL